LFNPAAEASWLDKRGLFSRLQFQFHWHNQSYDNFEHWLAAAFNSKTRNKIRRERKAVAAEVQLEVIERPSTDVIEALHRFYSHTCSQFGPWGRVYLNVDFFHHLVETWGDRLHAVVARRGQEIVGGAFNVRKGDRLYGRYWGCSEQVRFLHFEVCYYQPVQWCIEHGLQVFEPGHGGGHKYRRGFEPVLTYSSHLMSNARLHEGLRAHATQEAEHVIHEQAFLADKQRR
jgi:hypothetical protein